MPAHPSFKKIHDNMIAQYGKEKGDNVYHGWLQKHGLDDTKSAPSEIPGGARKEAWMSHEWDRNHLWIKPYISGYDTMTLEDIEDDKEYDRAYAALVKKKMDPIEAAFKKHRIKGYYRDDKEERFVFDNGKTWEKAVDLLAKGPKGQEESWRERAANIYERKVSEVLKESHEVPCPNCGGSLGYNSDLLGVKDASCGRCGWKGKNPEPESWDGSTDAEAFKERESKLYDEYDDVPSDAMAKTGQRIFQQLEPFKSVVKKDFSSTKGVERDAIGRVVLYKKDGTEFGRVPKDPELYTEAVKMRGPGRPRKFKSFKVTRRIETIAQQFKSKEATSPSDVTIKPAKNGLVDDAQGFAVFIRNHRVEIGMAEPNWFPTKQEAEEYRQEILNNKESFREASVYVKKGDKAGLRREIEKAVESGWSTTNIIGHIATAIADFEDIPAPRNEEPTYHAIHSAVEDLMKKDRHDVRAFMSITEGFKEDMTMATAGGATVIGMPKKKEVLSRDEKKKQYVEPDSAEAKQRAKDYAELQKLHKDWNADDEALTKEERSYDRLSMTKGMQGKGMSDADYKAGEKIRKKRFDLDQRKKEIEKKSDAYNDWARSIRFYDEATAKDSQGRFYKVSTVKCADCGKTVPASDAVSVATYRSNHPYEDYCKDCAPRHESWREGAYQKLPEEQKTKLLDAVAQKLHGKNYKDVPADSYGRSFRSLHEPMVQYDYDSKDDGSLGEWEYRVLITGGPDNNEEDSGTVTAKSKDDAKKKLQQDYGRAVRILSLTKESVTVAMKESSWRERASTIHQKVEGNKARREFLKERFEKIARRVREAEAALERQEARGNNAGVLKHQHKLEGLYKEMSLLQESHIDCSSQWHASEIARVLKGENIDVEVKGDKVFFPKSAESKVIQSLQRLKNTTPVIHQERATLLLNAESYEVTVRSQAPSAAWNLITSTLKEAYPGKSDEQVRQAAGHIWFKWMPKRGITMERLNKEGVLRAARESGFSSWKNRLERMHEAIQEPADDDENVNDPEEPGLPKMAVRSEVPDAGNQTVSNLTPERSP